jgi:peptide/nickel transport system permease protein
MVPTLLLVTIIVFLSIRLIPGNVIDVMQADMAGQGQIDTKEIAHRLGLDVPIHVQYVRWIGNIILHGDLGVSLRSGRPVVAELIARLPVSFELTLLALAIMLIIAVPIGVYSAIRQDEIGDYIGRSFAIFCIAVPGFWLGTMVIVLPSVWWNWSPSVEYIPFLQNPSGNLLQFIIPSAILGMALTGTTMRMTRTMMLEVLRQDYIRTAWAKGLRESVVVFRHALKNALIPVVTIVGLNIPVLIGGTVIIEQIFTLPGMGRLVLEALTKRDYTIVSGVNLFIACFVLAINLVVDIAYGYLDPRVQYK